MPEWPLATTVTCRRNGRRTQRKRQMSSLLTNNSAMVALQTIKATNNKMATVQSEISTGKSVNSAKDNATVWITLAFDE
uniref:flagellin N-terminal helical domain-containing protein n=1 Tax=Neogemmobacter tilapiae TaxID=875041 RepID=UPI003570D207